MLNAYRVAYDNFYNETSGAVLLMQQRRITAKGTGYSSSIDKSDPIYRTVWGQYRNPRNWRRVSLAKATLRNRLFAAFQTVAVSRFGEHWINIRWLVRAFMRAKPFVTLDPQNPDTHISFIGSGTKNDPKRRRTLTIQRYMTRNCRWLVDYLKMTDADISRFALEFRQFPYLGKMEILSGEDAFEVYRCDEIHSCMAGKNIIRDQFEHNPIRVKLVTYRIDGCLTIRAKFYRQDDDTFLLDRIYPNNNIICWSPDECRPSIEHDLREAGYDVTDDWTSITLCHPRGSSMPYMDIPDKFDRLSNSEVKFHPSGEHDADNTDGTDDSAQCTCRQCARRKDIEEMSSDPNGNSICESCYDRYVVWDNYDECDIWQSSARTLHDGRNCHRDNAVRLSSRYGYAYGHDNEVTLDSDSEWILTEDAVYCTHPEYTDSCYHCDSNLVVELATGETAPRYYSKQFDGKWYLVRELIQLADGNWYPPELCQQVAVTDDYGCERIVTVLNLSTDTVSVD